MPVPDLRLALYQPDIAGNTGAILRIGACFGMAVDVIGPAGFDLSDRALRRAGLDYVAMTALERHVDWASFREMQRREGRRLVLFTTHVESALWDFAFAAGDTLLFGRKSAGVPDDVHEAAYARLLIPMPGGGRSLNLAVAVGIAAAVASRQLERHGG